MVRIRSATYRVGDRFGDVNRPVRLNDAVQSYRDPNRCGRGMEANGCDQITAGGGYLPYRSFDYHRADIRYREDGGAPYGTVALHGAF